MSKHDRTAGRRKRTPRGVPLNVHNRTRETADEVIAKQLREERRQEALAEARREQERLERRIEREKVAPAMGPALGALYVAPVAVPEPVAESVAPIESAPWINESFVDTQGLGFRFPDLPWESDGTESLDIRQARAMLRQGYNIRKVVNLFGVGLRWLDDIPIDEAGYGQSE